MEVIYTEKMITLSNVSQGLGHPESWDSLLTPPVLVIAKSSTRLGKETCAHERRRQRLWGLLQLLAVSSRGVMFPPKSVPWWRLAQEGIVADTAWKDVVQRRVEFPTKRVDGDEDEA